MKNLRLKMNYQIKRIKGGEQPSLFLSMEAGGLEKDINGDGVNDLVTTVGTKVDTTIYLEENEQVIKAELFVIPDKIQVFHSEGNVFHIFFENRKLARYQYKDRQLHFVELTD